MHSFFELFSSLLIWINLLVNVSFGMGLLSSRKELLLNQRWIELVWRKHGKVEQTDGKSEETDAK